MPGAFDALQAGRFVIPFAQGNADPTGTTEGVPDGLTLLWISGGTDLKLSTFSSALGAWKTLTYA